MESIPIIFKHNNETIRFTHAGGRICVESWDVSFKKCHLENQRSMSWLRSRSDRLSIMLSIHIPFISNQTDHPFIKYSYLKFEPNIKVMGEVKLQGHIVGSISYQLTSILFEINLPSQSWDGAISKFDLENSRSKLHGGSNIFSSDTPFLPWQSALAFLR